MPIHFFDADLQEVRFEEDLFSADGFSTHWNTFRSQSTDYSLVYRYRKTQAATCYVIQTSSNVSEEWLVQLPYFDVLLFYHFLTPLGIFFPDGSTTEFYDRAGHVYTSYFPSLSIKDFMGGTQLLIAIPLSIPFIETIGLPVPLPTNFSHLQQNFIIDHKLLHILSDLLFHESPLSANDFLVDEFIRVLAELSLQRSVAGPFQPQVITKESLDWFHAVKSQLLTVKHLQLPVNKMFQIAGLSNMHQFRLLLRSLYGMSIPQLITEARMAEAQTLLKEAWTIKQVAAKTGFKNVFYFSKVFMRYTGIPPAQYQKVFGGK